MKRVDWIKCNNGRWCPFDTVVFDSSKSYKGVYTIGYQSNDYVYTVYVGQSMNIASRIEDHRQDEKITKYRERGDLLVTWADVPVGDMDGVERYVADKLKPLVGSKHPDVTPIEVNLPERWV